MCAYKSSLRQEKPLEIGQDSYLYYCNQFDSNRFPPLNAIGEIEIQT